MKILVGALCLALLATPRPAPAADVPSAQVLATNPAMQQIFATNAKPAASTAKP